MLEMNFGDGYSQRQNVGINNTKQIFNLNFANRFATEANAIKAFLKNHGGVDAFEFVPPNEVDPIKVICRMDEWSSTYHKGGLISISAKFEQVFE